MSKGNKVKRCINNRADCNFPAVTQTVQMLSHSKRIQPNLTMQTYNMTHI